MSYVEQQNMQEMLKSLMSLPELDYNDIMNMIDAYQIASAHHSAVGKFKGIVAFLKKGNALTVKNDKELINISSKIQLQELIKSSYMFGTISNSSFFETCFTE